MNKNYKLCHNLLPVALGDEADPTPPPILLHFSAPISLIARYVLL